MTEAERDRIRSYYRQRGPHQRRGTDELIRERRALLRRAAVEVGGQQPAQMRILDVGCGAGGDLVFWRDAGVPEEHLAGTEIIQYRAKMAAQALPAAQITPVDDFRLPFEARTFTLTSASLVFSSILDPAARSELFSEMVRVTAPGGIVVVYDFHVRKPWNHDVVAMTRRRIEALGRRPSISWPAGPFMPLLPLALRLPASLAERAIALLPRTHALHVWRRSAA